VAQSPFQLTVAIDLNQEIPMANRLNFHCFTNGSGGFFVSQSDDDLMPYFAPVPEPSTRAMVAGEPLALAGAPVRRRH
jgi:hypothetical protein